MIDPRDRILLVRLETTGDVVRPATLAGPVRDILEHGAPSEPHLFEE
jgi:hypothetical protein